MYVWMDGKIVREQYARISIFSHTLHYGGGIFEGIRCYETERGPAIFRLNDHIRRLFDSAHIQMLRDRMRFSQEDIKKAIIQLVKKNGIVSCYIRPLVYLSKGGLGVSSLKNEVSIAILTMEWGTYLGAKALEEGVTAETSAWARPAPNALPPHAKSVGNYLNSQFAKVITILHGVAEPVILDAQGWVAEGSGANIFIVRDSIVRTPPRTNVLPGITRDTIIKLATERFMDIREEFFPVDDIYIADEAFFVGTAAEITPIIEIDKRRVGNGTRGNVTKRLQELYFDTVKGIADRHHGWLTYVY